MMGPKFNWAFLAKYQSEDGSQSETEESPTHEAELEVDSDDAPPRVSRNGKEKHQQTQSYKKESNLAWVRRRPLYCAEHVRLPVLCTINKHLYS
jgi:hypothetical protein